MTDIFMFLCAFERREQNIWGYFRAFFWNIPRLTLIALILLYRATISPAFRPGCRYFPSCSSYALEALLIHGCFRGVFFLLIRLLRCHPWCSGGVDPVPSHALWKISTFSSQQLPNILVLNHPEIFSPILRRVEADR